MYSTANCEMLFFLRILRIECYFVVFSHSYFVMCVCVCFRLSISIRLARVIVFQIQNVKAQFLKRKANTSISKPRQLRKKGKWRKGKNTIRIPCNGILFASLTKPFSMVSVCVSSLFVVFVVFFSLQFHPFALFPSPSHFLHSIFETHKHTLAIRSVCSQYIWLKSDKMRNVTKVFTSW